MANLKHSLSGRKATALYYVNFGLNYYCCAEMSSQEPLRCQQMGSKISEYIYGFCFLCEYAGQVWPLKPVAPKSSETYRLIVY